MDKIVTIIRKSNDLVVLVSRTRYNFVPNLENLSKEIIYQLTNYYDSIESPIESISIKLLPNKNNIIYAWNYLQNIKIINKETLKQILIILLETQIDPCQVNNKLEILNLDFEELIIKPTAAHPRAYKGTKYKPPKAKQTLEINLCPYLSDEKNIYLILRKLEKFKTEVLEELIKINYHSEKLIKIDKNIWFKIDPNIIAHPKLIETNYKFPSLFIKYILPLIKNADLKQILKFLTIFWDLRLDKKNNLLMVIVRLLVLSQNFENVLQWCQIVAKQRQKHQSTFATLLIKTGVLWIDVNEQIKETFDEFNKLTYSKQYVQRLFFLLLAIKKNLCLDYVLTGFKLANKYEKDYKFLIFPQYTSKISSNFIEKLSNYIKSTEIYYQSFPLLIWRACGEMQGLIETFIEIKWKNLSKEIAIKYLRFYLEIVYLENHKEINDNWQFVKQESSKITSILYAISEKYQEKFITYLKAFYSWDDNENDIKTLNQALPISYILFNRLCRPPFSQNVSYFTAQIIKYFIYFGSDNSRKMFADAPNSSFQNLEKICYSKNTSFLIQLSIYSLMKRLPEWIVKCFSYFSTKLLKVAKLLGSFNGEIRISLIKSFMQHQIMSTDFANLALAEAFLIIEDITKNNEKIFNSIPKQLKDFLNGQSQIKQQQFEYYKQQFFQQLLRTQLDVLENLIFDKLSHNYKVKTIDKNLEYALKVSYYTDSNQRPLKRFLRAYLNGDQNYLLNHSESQKWLKNHKELNINLWQTGIEFSQESEKYGLITIDLEKDPLEVLKLGVYSGSCLELGGGFTYSAVAILLDINKQVLYARNKKGKVLARQLVAISEDNKLVCFEIYPPSVSDEIKAMFRDYDELFAKKLNFPINKSYLDYEIEHILSKDWWDDRAWDLEL